MSRDLPLRSSRQCRHTLRRAVVRHFNERYGWAADDVSGLEDLIANESKRRPEFSQAFNELRVLDPAVGSGHFLVSALNELLAIKSELGLLLVPVLICVALLIYAALWGGPASPAQRGPAANIRPAHRGRDHSCAIGFLHHRVVDRFPLDLGEGRRIGMKPRSVLTAAAGGA